MQGILVTEEIGPEASLGQVISLRWPGNNSVFYMQVRTRGITCSTVPLQLEGRVMYGWLGDLVLGADVCSFGGGASFVAFTFSCRRAARRRRPLGLKSSPLLPFSMRTRSDGLGWRSCVSAHSRVGGQHQGGARRPAAATPSCRALPLSRLPHATRWRTLRRRNTCRRGRSSRRC